MLRPAVLLALGSPVAASWLKIPFVKSPTEETWTPPQETKAADSNGQVALQWSPRPTQAPRLLARMELLPRLDGYTLGSDTCGFFDGNNRPITCITNGATCTYTDSYFGCCEPDKNCNSIRTTCIDYQASVSGACDLPDDFHTICCNSAALGACFTYLFSTTDKDQSTQTYSLLDCSASTGTATLLDYDPVWSRTHTSGSSTASETSAETSSSSTSDSNNDDDDNDDGGSSTNIGAIAGGAVGGAAAMGLVALAAFLFWRRSKKNKAAAAAATAASSQQPPAPMSQSPGQNYAPSSPSAAYPSGAPAGYQGYSPQGYDPHASTYGQQPYPQGFAPYDQQQQFQGQYPPQQGYQNQYPSQYGAAFNQPPTGSPPPPGDQSPGIKEVEATQKEVPPATELDTVNPPRTETNRAELGHS